MIKHKFILALALSFPLTAFAQTFTYRTETPGQLELSTKHPDTPALLLNTDGTITFFDINGVKIKDYDPGKDARQSIMKYIESQDVSSTPPSVVITPGVPQDSPQPFYAVPVPDLNDNNGTKYE